MKIRTRSRREPICVVLVLMAFASTVSAHHSYALFDQDKKSNVSATIAKVEWVNPHVFIWGYVPDAAQPNGYQLYAFESGAINMLVRQGWTRDTMKVGETISVEYWPLRDGRPGGYYISAIHADGKVSMGDPNVGRVRRALNAGAAGPAPTVVKP